MNKKNIRSKAGHSRLAPDRRMLRVQSAKLHSGLPSPAKKILSLKQAARLCAAAKRSGKKVVACTGSFDLLHAGHVHSLQTARSFGDLLIVGLNSDASYRAYKDKRGPLVPQKERAELLAALSCVDYVILFHEPDPIHFVTTLRPSIYANGASYGKDCVEAPAVRAIGARLRLIPIRQGLSTSALVEKIIQRYKNTSSTRPVVFLDRDGVLIRDKGYAHRPEQISFMPGIIERLKAYAKKGYSFIVITNQSGIARGLFTMAQMNRFHHVLRSRLKKHGISLLDLYACPHHPQGSVKPYARLCDCRKPRPGLLLKACKEHRIDLSRSLFLGDKESDWQAARAAGVKAVRFP